MNTRVLRVVIVLAAVISYSGVSGATAVGQALTQNMPSGSGAGSAQTTIIGTRSSSSSGIEGKIVIGPMCPEARNAKCADRPYRATVIVKRSIGPQGLKEFTRVRSSVNGHFRVTLPPGVYELVPLSGSKPWPRASSQAVVVKPNEVTRVVIRYDTGIR